MISWDNRIKPTTTSRETIPLEKAAVDQVCGAGQILAIVNNPVNRPTPFALGAAKSTTEGNSEDSIMVGTPAISETFRAKLSISSEIEELRSEDVYFKYALNSIFNLIDNALNGIGHIYHVGVALDVDQDLPSWRRANIIVGINGMDYQSILNLWDDIGSEVGSYLESLRKNPIFPQEKALRFYNFINISFTPEGNICQ
ncbi:MAG: hypothetical protein NTY37_09090 [Methanothrix sp.]|nr:hypothetical protein [Methanothrix sp.]